MTALMVLAVPFVVSALVGGGLVAACSVRDWLRGGAPR